jgi:hypothetical protein
MGKLLRLSLALGALTTVFAGFNFARPTWAAGTGADVWALPELVHSLEEEQAKFTELDERGRHIHMRAEGRQRVVTEVIAGRTTLLDAAASIQELNRLDTGGPKFGATSRGNSEGERLCRQVIRWVDGALSEQSPEDRDPVVRRLEQDLSDLMRADGTVHLPAE